MSDDNNKTSAKNESLIDKLKQNVVEGIDTIKDKLENSELAKKTGIEKVTPDNGEVKDWLHQTQQQLSSQVSSIRNRVGSVFKPNLATMELVDIQAIILRDRPVPYYGTLVAVKIHDSKIGRELLKSVLPDVSSSKDWHKDMDANLCIVMTFEGLKALGVPKASLDTFPENFKIGMAGRAEKLGDTGANAPENWHEPFGDKGEIHICAAIIANSKENWQTKLTELKNDLAPYINKENPSAGAIEIIVEHDFGTNEEVKNVFGYRDGISNPEVAGSGIEVAPNDEKPIASGEFVMGYEGEAGTIAPMPQPEVLGKNGSFMVLRKYQSHVADFNRYCQEQTENQAEADKLAAKMFGRWRSGAPITLSPDHDDEALGKDNSRNNKFDYTDDQYGKGCPFGAHARRMNPRNTKDFILADVRLHRIIRRSVSFGDIVPPEVTQDDGKERGLFFIGINAHAMDTLEFLQSQWINDGNFMNIGEERDPLLGVHDGNTDSDADTFTEPADPIRKRHKGILQFNTLQGGEYLFIPSISALKWISELPES